MIFSPTLADVRELLPDAVLLSIDPADKKPIHGKKWQQITFAQSQKEGHQRLLDQADSIGVLLGPPSGNLVCLDCDSMPFFELMPVLCPFLKDTLITRGRRGGGYWIRIKDDYPAQVHAFTVTKDNPLGTGLTPDPKTGLIRIGELRCGRGQSIICGRLQSGIFYEWLNSASPLVIGFAELMFPSELAAPGSKAKRATRPDRGQVSGGMPSSSPSSSSDRELLLKAKAVLTIPVLWRHFGFAPLNGDGDQNVCSPFRSEQRPSFSIYADGARAKDHTTGQDYDSFDFFQEASHTSSRTGFIPFVKLAGFGAELHRRKNAPSQDTNATPGIPTHSNAGVVQLVRNTLGIYFDPEQGCYWKKDDRENWIRIRTNDLQRHLADFGFNVKTLEGQTCSQIDQIINTIQISMNVEYAGSLAGHFKGIELYGDKRLLIKDSPVLIEPAAGDWSVLSIFLLNLLGIDQLDYLYGWIKMALETLYAHSLRPGQALVFCGPKDCGKSLLQKLITLLLGGRVCKPYLYMSGQTSFNGNMFWNEHLALEDEQPATDIKSRRFFGTKIKEITAVDDQNCHIKFLSGLTLSPFWRLTISLNEEPENLLILPPFDESMEDKLIIFKAEKHQMPMPTASNEERAIFWKALVSSLPAFVHYLFQWPIPQKLVSQRYGIAHFQHPDILYALGELSPEIRLLNLIDAELFALPGVSEWEGASLALEQRLMAYNSSIRTQARELLMWQGATGAYLSRLRKLHPERISFHRNNRNRIWTILPPT
jgi:hypothetical protein